MERHLKPKVRLIPHEEARRDAQLSSKVNEMMTEAEYRFRSAWESKGWNLYVIFDEDAGNPVGVTGWAGPVDHTEPSWWVRPGSRRKGYGKRAVEKLAKEMYRKGVLQVTNILIDTKDAGEQKASEKLARLLRRCFNKLLRTGD